MLNEIQTHEISKQIRAIAAERRLEVNRVFEIFEQAIERALISFYGKAKIKVEINQDSGKISIYEKLKVVADKDYDINADILYENDVVPGEETSFHFRTIALSDAIRTIDEKATKGQIIDRIIPDAWNKIKKTTNFIKLFNNNFSRSLSFMIKEKEYNFFIKKQGTIITAVVQRFSADGYVLIYEGYEILLPSDPNLNQKVHFESPYIRLKNNKPPIKKSETILSERFGAGDHINVYIKSVSRGDDLKYQVITSRTHPLFLAELLKQNVSEIREGQVAIYKIIRIPGIKAKVAVHAVDKGIDPVGACVGIRGTRIKSVSQELKGEKIDVLEYSDDIETLAQNAIKVTKVLNVIVDDMQGKITIVVPDRDLGSAIGKKGINTRILSELMKCHVEIVGEELYSNNKKDEFLNSVKNLEKILDVEEIIAQLLVTTGYKTPEDIVLVDNKNLLKIEYFDDEIVNEIRSRAFSYLSELKKERISSIDQEYVEYLHKFDDNDDLVMHLVDSNIKNLQELSDLDIYELSTVLGIEKYDEEFLSSMLINARKIVNSIQ